MGRVKRKMTKERQDLHPRNMEFAGQKSAKSDRINVLKSKTL
jgi:hypothetical protein